MLLLHIKGDNGAANIGVHEWRDDVTGAKFEGFPYLLASEQMQEAKLISVPALKDNQP